MPARPVSATRRTALALGAVGVLAVAGCDLGDADSDPDGSTPTPAEDPDATLVEEVLTEVAAVTGLVAGVGSRFARLAAQLTELRGMHDAHTEALGGAPATDPRTPRIPATATAALALVRQRETRLQSRLVGASVAADSGALARLLASMSAAVAQRVATLTGEPA